MRLADRDDPLGPVAHVHDRRPGRAGAARHAVPRARSAGRRRGHPRPPRSGALAPRRSAAELPPGSADRGIAAMVVGGERRGGQRARPCRGLARCRGSTGPLPNGYAVLDGEVMHDDQWDGYPAERDRLAAGWTSGPATAGAPCSCRATCTRRGRSPGRAGRSTARRSGWSSRRRPCRRRRWGTRHYPGLSVLLDRAVKAMDHVAWAEVTRRGYAILDITPERVQSEFWFVAPYDDDPSATQHLGAAFVTRRGSWPPSLERTEETTDDPSRAGLPEPLPLGRTTCPTCRRRRRVRLTAEAAVPSVVGRHRGRPAGLAPIEVASVT